MTQKEETTQLVLTYWKSWQQRDWALMRSCLADELDLGGKMIPADVIVDISSKGPQWRNVTMAASLFTDREGALFYRGINTANEQEICVGEYVEVAGGKINKIVAIFGISPVPA